MNNPCISENVIESLSKIYENASKDRLLHCLSTAPNISVLRVNTNVIQVPDAIRLLQKQIIDYEIEQLSSIPDALLIYKTYRENDVKMIVDKELIVDTECGAALLRGADCFAPGVLAADQSIRKGDIVSVYADLERKCRRGFIKKFEGKKFYIGNGISHYDRQELFQNNCKLMGVAVKMVDSQKKLLSFESIDRMFVFPQNLPSIIVGHVLNPQENDRILDMCAAPGGKTTHIAALLGSKAGTIISIDKSEKKIQRIKANCEKLQISNIQCYAYDSTKLLDESSSNDELQANEGNQFKPPYPCCSFNKILLDPPCSGVGQRPQLRYVMSDKELSSYQKYQRKLITTAVGLLQENGILVYSTCTLLPQENEQQVAWILSTYPNMKLLQQEPRVGRPGLHGHNVSEEDCKKLQRFDWCYVDENIIENQNVQIDIRCRDTIGFFIAKFVKLKL